MATKSTRPVPEGYATVTASLTVKDAARAIEFYKKAFGAEERERMVGPQGGIMHAEITIGSSIVMLADEMPGMTRGVEAYGGSPVSFYVYVNDADAAHKRALAAGAKEAMPMSDMFWGDRTGQVVDPFGYRWTFATRTVEMTPEEMREAGERWMKTMAQKK